MMAEYIFFRRFNSFLSQSRHNSNHRRRTMNYEVEKILEKRARGRRVTRNPSIILIQFI